MSEGTNNLSHKLGKVAGKEIEALLAKLFTKEEDQKDFFPQEDYEGKNNPCEERAKDMLLHVLDEYKRNIQDGTTQVGNSLKGCIAAHRQDSHDEDTAQEIIEASGFVEEENLSIVSMGWWEG